MSGFEYEFLTYEAFPEDQYVKEIVTVMINGAVILPYQHVKMKDGGAFWTFPGSQAVKNGTKKRINAEFESKRAKMGFETALDEFINKKTVDSQPSDFNATEAERGTFSGHETNGVGVVDQNLPF